MSSKPITPPPPPWVSVISGSPPAGMIKAEADILTAWLSRNWDQYDSVTYNVRVGQGQDPGPGVPEYARKAAIANSQRRIDALLWKGDQPTIVEVKVRGSLWAIGQLLGYRELWLMGNPGKHSPILIMLAGDIDGDTVYACGRLGVICKVVTL